MKCRSPCCEEPRLLVLRIGQAYYSRSMPTMYAEFENYCSYISMAEFPKRRSTSTRRNH